MSGSPEVRVIVLFRQSAGHLASQLEAPAAKESTMLPRPNAPRPGGLAALLDDRLTVAFYSPNG
jgi:hypothetical protein